MNCQRFRVLRCVVFIFSNDTSFDYMTYMTGVDQVNANTHGPKDHL